MLSFIICLSIFQTLIFLNQINIRKLNSYSLPSKYIKTDCSLNSMSTKDILSPIEYSQKNRKNWTLKKLSQTPQTLQNSSKELLSNKLKTCKKLKTIASPTAIDFNNKLKPNRPTQLTRTFNKLDDVGQEMSRLQRILRMRNKTSQQYDEIEQIFRRWHIAFFEQIRIFLPNEEYYELIDKCEILNLTDNNIICRKGKQDEYFYVLLEGKVSFNEQKSAKNSLLGKSQIEYSQIFFPKKGSLLNLQTLNSPKHNIYTVISHSLTTLIAIEIAPTYSRLLKKYLIKQQEQKVSVLAKTPLFNGIVKQNIKTLLPYFFIQYFYNFNQLIYKQHAMADFAYCIIDGQVELLSQQKHQKNHENSTLNKTKVQKIVKFSKSEIFGIDQQIFQPSSKYLFTARVCSQSLKVICISYKSLAHIQTQFSLINENIDFYIKKTALMHNKILLKNINLVQKKENLTKKRKKKRNKKKKRYFEALEWWGLAQNIIGNKKFRLQMPKYISLQQNKTQLSKSQPMLESRNCFSQQIQGFQKKLAQKGIKRLDQIQQIKYQMDSNDASPYQINFRPKLNIQKVKVLDIKPRKVNETQKVKKKLLSYAKNIGSLCDKLNLD